MFHMCDTLDMYECVWAMSAMKMISGWPATRSRGSHHHRQWADVLCRRFISHRFAPGRRSGQKPFVSSPLTHPQRQRGGHDTTWCVRLAVWVRVCDPTFVARWAIKLLKHHQSHKAQAQKRLVLRVQVLPCRTIQCYLKPHYEGARVLCVACYPCAQS